MMKLDVLLVCHLCLVSFVAHSELWEPQISIAASQFRCRRSGSLEELWPAVSNLPLGATSSANSIPHCLDFEGSCHPHHEYLIL